MSHKEERSYERALEYESNRSPKDIEIAAINMWGGDWYIEVVNLLHGATIVGTGLFYKCTANEHTKLFFESAKQRGLSDAGNYFKLILRNTTNTAEIYDSVGITKKHFEQVTGLKALTPEEYYEQCESVPYFEDIGATLIDLSALKKG